MTREQTLARAQRAETIINLPEYKMLMDEIKEELFAKFSNTKIDAVEERENIHKVMHGVTYFDKKLNSYIDAVKVMNAHNDAE
ncbi:hypothetical protein [Agrobacterium pusense]|uniref:hypothetical protein n=1 Tax=Agrobacterium pusense TaxID=648995 RepID=UPI0022B90524|nr:hypothetical protein [Agrobacterium pusense]MCZ7926190.1 hypothetical protein [Agrobacterium pusense]